MYRKIVLLFGVLLLLGFEVNAQAGAEGSAWDSLKTRAAQLAIVAATRAMKTSPEIDKRWKVVNKSKYSVFLNGTPVSGGAITGTFEATLHVSVMDLASDKHIKDFVIDLSNERKIASGDGDAWDTYLEVALSTGFFRGISVFSEWKKYTDEEIKGLMLPDIERTEWQVINKSSYDINVNGTLVARKAKLNGTLRDVSMLQVTSDNPQDSFLLSLPIDLSRYKGLFLYQRSQWLQVEVTNKFWFKPGIKFSISLKPYTYWPEGWTRRDVIGTAATVLLLQHWCQRFARYGRR